MADNASKTSSSERNHGNIVDQFPRNEIDENILKQITPEVLAGILPIVVEQARARTGLFLNQPGNTAATDRGEVDRDREDEKENNDETPTDPRHEHSFTVRISHGIRSFSVKNSLSDDPDGKAILSSYNRNKSLIPSSRNRIVNIVVRCARKIEPRLHNEAFEVLAKKIVQVFPTENERTYYVPPMKKKDSSTGVSVASKGKIPIAFRNALHKGQQLANLVDEFEAEKLRNNAKTKNVDAKVEYSKRWLSVNNSPWETVEEHWNITRQLRNSDLSKEGTVEIGTFIEEWPILKHPTAYLLIEKDFSKLHLTDVHITRAGWDSFFQEIKSIRPINRRDHNATALDECLALTEITENSKSTIQILLLPHLIPPTKKVAKNWKPTICECKDSLLMHVQVQQIKFYMKGTNALSSRNITMNVVKEFMVQLFMYFCQSRILVDF